MGLGLHWRRSLVSCVSFVCSFVVGLAGSAWLLARREAARQEESRVVAARYCMSTSFQICLAHSRAGPPSTRLEPISWPARAQAC